MAGLTLRNGPMELRLRSDWGGRVTRLCHEAFGDLLVPIDEALGFDPWAWPKGGAFPLIPFHGRIKDAQFSWQGETFQITPHPAQRGHALHGHTQRFPWAVRERGPDRATLEFTHHIDENWPFDFTAQQIFRLDVDRLSVDMSITNTGSGVMPYDLGWHPYFPKAKAFETDARGHWPEGETAGFPQGHFLPSLPNSFFGRTSFLGKWNRFDVISNARLTLTASVLTDHVVVHDDPPTYTCVEPACAPPNSVNIGVAKTLSPQEIATISLCLAVSAV